MGNRQRWDPTYDTKGAIGRFGQVEEGYVYLLRGNWCDEVVAPGDCNAFLVSHWNAGDPAGGRINRGTRGQWNPAWLENAKLQCFNDPDTWPFTLHQSFDGDKGDGAYATETAARTNPSRPYVDVPAELLQLGDITHLLKNAGETLIQKLAGNYIKYQFGIAPLVGDLYKLTNFHEQVVRRVVELQKLRKAKGLRRTITLANFSWQDASNVIMHQTSDYFYQGVVEQRAQCIVKGHARWIPTMDLSQYSQPELAALAKKSVLGLTVDFATLWEAVPWSWLIDYGTQVGNFLKAYRNIVPASLEKLCVSRQIHQTYTHKSTNEPEVSGFSVERYYGYRNPWGVTPTAHFPFLSGEQMGILSSLAITRAR